MNSRGTSEDGVFLRRSFAATILLAVAGTLWITPPAPTQPASNRDLLRAFAEAKGRIPGERERYLAVRSELIRFDEEERFDALLRARLTDSEKRATASLSALQASELASFQSHEFPPALPFFLGRQAMQQSRLFSILQRMPKGGALHIHSTSAGRASVLVRAAKRRECFVEMIDGENGERKLTGRMRFIPDGSEPPENYFPAADIRATLGNDPFEEQLAACFVLDLQDERSGDVWPRFAACFHPLGTALSYRPVFEEYFLDAFQTFANDGVSYVEMRTTPGEVHDLEGDTFSNIELLHNLRDRVREEIPGFDFKLIISAWRGVQHGSGVSRSLQQSVRDSVEQAMTLRAKYPDFIVGFDLVGHEDGGGDMEAFLDVWLDIPALRQEMGIDLPFYLHAGETNWVKVQNLYDASLLKSRRIGHGLNLYLLPELEKRYRRLGIAVEVCPISNQILGYVRDLRTHPANGYVRRGLPLVISSDDPAIFDYEGLSPDYWMALMSWDLDLPALKQFAQNSITYSAMSDDEKRGAQDRWEEQWDAFIQEVIREFPDEDATPPE